MDHNKNISKLDISSFYTCAPKITIYDIWFLKYKMRQTEIFIIFPFQPLNNLENQNFNIEKSTWRYYHVTHFHHKWQSHDVGSWDMEHDKQNFLSFQTVFCPFTTPMDSENQNFEKIKHLKILSFYKCAQ